MDAGNNSLNNILTDQRGAGFSRIVDGPDGDATATVDIGAFEQQVPVSQIADAVMNEDTTLVIPFHVGDRSAITSITATSSNQVLVPNHPANLSVADVGTTEIITVTPATNLVGTTEITVTVNSTGGPTSRTFLVTVNPVNDAPSFEIRQATSSNEDAGLVSVANFVSNLSAGPPDEASQTFTFQVTSNTNAALFTTAPAISPTGTLTYVSAPNASGSATITVRVKDNGGTANGGQDTSRARTFTITVNPINDPPVNSVPGPQSVIENNVLTFSAANANRISISDIDAGDATVQVVLSVGFGVLSINTPPAGLTFFIGDGTADSVMLFRGSIATINSALSVMTYKHTNGFSGPDSLSITTNDLGASGFGLVIPDSDSVAINVLDGGVLQFSSTQNSANEDVGTATVTVTRLFGFAGATSVNFATSNGTAIGSNTCGAGIDYLNTSGTLSWADNESASKTFNVPICPDALNEEDESINLTLSAVTGSGALVSSFTATLTIVNDDAPVLLAEEMSAERDCARSGPPDARSVLSAKSVQLQQRSAATRFAVCLAARTAVDGHGGESNCSRRR